MSRGRAELLLLLLLKACLYLSLACHDGSSTRHIRIGSAGDALDFSSSLAVKILEFLSLDLRFVLLQFLTPFFTNIECHEVKLFLEVVNEVPRRDKADVECFINQFFLDS